MVVLMLPVNVGLSIVLATSLGAVGPVIGSIVGVVVFQLIANWIYVARAERRMRAAKAAAPAGDEALIPADEVTPAVKPVPAPPRTRTLDCCDSLERTSLSGIGDGVAVAIMFVCNACICRSPLMAFTFAQAVRDSPLGVEWNLQSRGVDAQRDASVCDFVARLIVADPDGIGFAEAHRSSPVVAAELSDFDLVITASRDERSDIAKLSPRMRTRTFTLREAIALGNGLEMRDRAAPGLRTFRRSALPPMPPRSTPVGG